MAYRLASATSLGRLGLQVGPVSGQVVRIEAGMVIVDSRGVDQDTGKDQDPEHEQAEVEETWRPCFGLS